MKYITPPFLILAASPTFSPYPRSFVIISRSVCRTLMQSLSSFSSSSCLVCLISLHTNISSQVLFVMNTLAHMSIKDQLKMVFQGLLAYKTSTLTLLARVCVFREEQLGSVQHVHQNRQLSLDQRAQTVLKS